MITAISYEEIFPIWQIHLWPNRISNIEPNSAMVYFRGYEMKNMCYQPTFFAYKINNEIAGVNSGHYCFDDTYRSRGLYVFPKFRKQGIGTALLEATVNEAIKTNAYFIWSFPRKESWHTYERVGFSRTTDWEVGELGMNAYCKKDLK